MKDTIYKFFIYIIFSSTVFFSIFLIISDNLSPFTTQASLHRNIANIAPEVSGIITRVLVKNGQQIHVEEPLFNIDSEGYEIMVKQAQAELHQAQDADSAKWQELAVAEQILSQREFEYINVNRKHSRNKALLSKGLITIQDLDNSLTDKKVANSAIEASNAEVKRIQAELSNQSHTAAIELAEAKLANATLDLEHTQVISKTQGVITNLQLQAGSYITQGTSALFIIDEKNAWVSADFNEKGLDKLTVGRPVFVVFDALPGRVFEGTIQNQERAIRDTENANGQLSSVTNDSRWIREQQKVRTRIKVNELNPVLISGSRASVIVQSNNTILSYIGNVWIHLVAMFRYIY
ncbi:HlyD family secretion protein [Vibrio splendidus]|uniref:HlyD family secretion protein n=1 Tax=Vibrio splendidus TaxID=29497 RepID=UPI002469A2DC|nr:HlyD family secretion protein [Vibrio splendidus]MDH5903083.1 HlyD family secretion protein [Vibrio splendidus]